MTTGAELPLVRQAVPADAPSCRAIYARYVEETVISFEEVAPSVQDVRRLIESSLATHDWLVLEDATGILGFAYGTSHRSRAAYRWACDVSVYVEMGRRRTGAGRLLYDALLPRLVDRGYRTAMAGITLPNEASEGLHRSLGFETVGVYRRVGWKLGRWHDVLWLQKQLVQADGTPDGPPAELR